jgi:Outer membrane protein beta-barrel domain
MLRETYTLFNTIRLVRLRQLGAAATIAAAFVVCGAGDASAQGFFSPLFGYDYGGDSICKNLTGCEQKKLNIGFSFGKLGKAGGFEEEIAWAKDFFGSTPNGADSNVLTVMSNFMIAPKIGPVRPYGLFGFGLMKAHVNGNPINVLSFTNNTFAWDIGAGAMVMFGDHVGVRGDIRHFHSFQELNLLGLSLGGGDTKLNFGRFAGALVLQF